MAGAVGQAACLSWFGMARSPHAAAAANCLNQVCYVLHHSGFDANLIEVGGEPTLACLLVVSAALQQTICFEVVESVGPQARTRAS